MAKSRTKGRSRYTQQRRAEILAIARQRGLTAVDVQKRFGVVPLTYYAWRKRAKAARLEQQKEAQSDGSLRRAVRARLARRLPRILDEEVDRFLKSVLGED